MMVVRRKTTQDDMEMREEVYAAGKAGIAFILPKG